jgi:hypothetical protein
MQSIDALDICPGKGQQRSMIDFCYKHYSDPDMAHEYSWLVVVPAVNVSAVEIDNSNKGNDLRIFLLTRQVGELSRELDGLWHASWCANRGNDNSEVLSSSKE